MTRAAPRPRDGFTLLELLIVISIILVLAASIIGWLVTAQKRAENRRAMAGITLMTQAVESYKEKFNIYPVIESSSDWSQVNHELLIKLFNETQTVESRSGVTQIVGPAVEPGLHGTYHDYLGDSDGDGEPGVLFDTNDDLAAGVEMLDPWHNPYRYRIPGLNHRDDIPDATDNRRTYDLWSAGRDGVDDDPGAPEEDRDDFTNWLQHAEGQQ